MKSLVRQALGRPLPRKRGRRGPKRRRSEPRRTSRPRHPRRMRKPEATRARKPEATSARKPEATSARKPEATSARRPEATSVTEVMRPRAAVSAANWAAHLGWVITATKLTGMRPIDRSYRKREAQQHAA